MGNKIKLSVLALVSMISANSYADNAGRENYQEFNSNQRNPAYNQQGYNNNQQDYNRDSNRPSNSQQGYYNNQDNNRDYNRSGNNQQGYYYQQNNRSGNGPAYNQGQSNNCQDYQCSRNNDRQDNSNRNQSSNSYYSRQDDKGQHDRDAEISKKVTDVITASTLSSGYPNVTFEVTNGNVILKGSVKSLNDKSKLEDTVRKIDGVNQIDNQITVASEKPTANIGTRRPIADLDSKINSTEDTYLQDSAVTDSDRLLNTQIRNKFSGWFTTDYKSLTLNTNNGIVTISGTVDSSDDLKKINEKLKAIPGVKSVNNRVIVKNR